MISSYWPYLVALVLPFLSVMLGQALLNRVLKGKNPQLITMISMVLGYFVFFGVLDLLPFPTAHDFGFYAYYFFFYSFAAYTYFHIFNMSETSRRVRLITQIGDRQVSMNELTEIYDDREMVKTRLDRLLALDQISERNGLYYPRRKLFAITAQILYSIGRLLGRPWAPMLSFKKRMKNA